MYIMVSWFRVGFARDMLMIWSAWLCEGYVIVHVAGGDYDDFYGTQPRCWRSRFAILFDGLTVSSS